MYSCDLWLRQRPVGNKYSGHQQVTADTFNQFNAAFNTRYAAQVTLLGQHGKDRGLLVGARVFAYVEADHMCFCAIGYVSCSRVRVRLWHLPSAGAERS